MLCGGGTDSEATLFLDDGVFRFGEKYPFPRLSTKLVLNTNVLSSRNDKNLVITYFVPYFFLRNSHGLHKGETQEVYFLEIKGNSAN